MDRRSSADNRPQNPGFGSAPLAAPDRKIYEQVVAQISSEAREYLCYTPEGRLLIGKSHQFNPLVTSFISRLQRLQLPFQKEFVELSVIQGARATQRVAEATKTDSDMQKAAKQLFDRAYQLRASDIHLRVSKRRNTEIVMRVHGELRRISEEPYIWGDQLCYTIYHAMSDVSDSAFEPLSRQDARIADRAKLPGGLDGIRVATTPQVDGYLMVLRLLYNDAANSYDVCALGYDQKHRFAVELMKKRPYGINIIAGPTGSGKSTTLQRVLSAINQESQGRRHIITVEDPPEYPIEGAIQTPVTNADTEEARSLALQAAIRGAMRLDPDIIMVGEVRDGPSASLAVRATMTGHQVWTTVHATHAFQVFDRLMDLGVQLENLTDHTIVTGIICQRLIKLLCPHCKVPLSSIADKLSPSDLNRVLSVVEAERVHVRGEGCPECRGDGTKDRTAVAEIIVPDARLMALLRGRDRIGAVQYWRESQQGKTMLGHAIDKVRAGLIDPFDAEKVVGPLNMDQIELDHQISAPEIVSAVK